MVCAQAHRLLMAESTPLPPTDGKLSWTDTHTPTLAPPDCILDSHRHCLRMAMVDSVVWEQDCQVMVDCPPHLRSMNSGFVAACTMTASRSDLSKEATRPPSRLLPGEPLTFLTPPGVCTRVATWMTVATRPLSQGWATKGCLRPRHQTSQVIQVGGLPSLGHRPPSPELFSPLCS